MAAEEVNNIKVRFSVLQSLSMSNLEDSLDRNIHLTQAMQAQIANAMSQIKEEPTVRAEPNEEAAQLIQDQQLAEILEEEMTHREIDKLPESSQGVKNIPISLRIPIR